MNINFLPFELKIFIFTYCDYRTRLLCKLVCQHWLEILMTEYEFGNDRSLVFSNCTFNNNLPPVNIFNHAKYKYKMAMLNYKSKQSEINENIDKTFWENIGVVTLSFDVITPVDHLYVLSKFKTIKTFVDGIYALDTLIKQYENNTMVQNFVAENIETIEFNCFYDYNTWIKLFNSEHLKKMFPNLKVVCCIRLFIDTSYKFIDWNKIIPYELRFNEIFCVNQQEYNYLIENSNLFNYEKIHLFGNLNAAYKKKANEIVCLEIFDFTNATSLHEYNKHENKITIFVNQYCINFHIVKKLYNLKFLVLKLWNEKPESYCEICKRNLFFAFQNIEFLEIQAHTSELNNENKFKFSITKIFKNFKKLRHFSVYQGLQHELNVSYEDMCSLSDIGPFYEMEKFSIHVWYSQLKFTELIPKVFPNLTVLEICNFSSFNRNIVEILLDLLPGLKKLKELYISFKSSHIIIQKADSSKIIDVISLHGQRLQVSFLNISFIKKENNPILYYRKSLWNIVITHSMHQFCSALTRI